MNEISSQLANYGFSINSLDAIIKRNNFSKKFSTLQFYCILLTAEKLSIKVEDEYYMVNGGSAIFVGPQKLIELISNPRGKEFYVIAFSAKFYDSAQRDGILLNSKIFFNEGSSIFISPYFGNDEFNRILLVERLLSFSNKNQKIFSAAAHNTIEALLLDAQLNCEVTKSELSNKDQKATATYNNFKLLLQRDYRISKNVNYYSNLLKMTPRALTENTEQIIGKSAKQIIIDKLKFECEKAIQYTSLTFSEITYELGFTDEANFTNFVKKHLGNNPSVIRKQKLTFSEHLDDLS